MSFIVKLIFILIMAAVPAVPFVLENISFRRECVKKAGYRRFWLVAWTILYIILITIALSLIQKFLVWLGSVSFIRQIVSALAISDRAAYFGRVIVALLVNFAIGMFYWLTGRAVRFRIAGSSLTEPKKEGGEFSFFQKIERKAVEFFHREVFFFVGKILRYLSIVLSAVYLLFFIVCQIPGVFEAPWIPYDFISMLFDAGCIYPSLVLLGFWSLTYFFSGIERLDDECPQYFERGDLVGKRQKIDLGTLNGEIKKYFQNFYVADIRVPNTCADYAAASHRPETKQIRAEVESGLRNAQMSEVEGSPRNTQSAQELYLDVTDKLFSSEQSLLLNGNFFSGFSMYFLRYLAAVLARGDNAVFVCNSEAQIDAVYDYLMQGFAENASLYCPDGDGSNRLCDMPIWKIAKVSGEYNVAEESLVDDCNVLVTSLAYLCSDRFEARHGQFITLVDIIVFVEILDTINMFNRQLAVLNTWLQHLVSENIFVLQNGKAQDQYKNRYMSRQVRYIGFDTSRTPGLDKVVQNMLGIAFETADAMYYGPQMTVSCYNYDPKPDESGGTSERQFLNTGEEVGVVMNMALLCLAKGADKVTVLTDDVIPYANIQETLYSNRGGLSIQINSNNLVLNRPDYNPDNYSVVIAVDPGDNLPAAARKYISMLSGRKALLILFSRPYLWRDYYQSKIGELWDKGQIQRIPVEEGTRREVAQRILVKANAGGIFRSEVLRLAAELPELADDVAKQDVDAILRRMLEIYGLLHEGHIDLFRFFEYVAVQEFNSVGQFLSDTKIMLRRQGQLFEMLNGRNMVTLVVGDQQRVLPIPRIRLTQNYIAGQNMIYNGCIYHIQKVDTAEGRLYVRLASGGMNDETYQYMQDREYHLEIDPQAVQYVYPVKHVILHRAAENVAVDEAYISVMRVPMEVLTHGYFEVDRHIAARNTTNAKYHKIDDVGNDGLAIQTYRRYGSLSKPTYSANSVLEVTDLCAYEREAQVMAVRFCGKFGADSKKTMQLAAFMLNELLRSMFPSVADSIAVCSGQYGEFSGQDAKEVLRSQPALRLDEGQKEDDSSFRLFIIEDCATDLGVVSALMSAGDDILNTLFRPVYLYLRWYFTARQNNNYLYCGLDHEPDCFDAPSLCKLAELLSDDRHDIQFIDIHAVTEYVVCDFCGRRYAKGDSLLELQDGRKMCKECRESLVSSDRKTLEQYIGRIRIFLESAYGVTIQETVEVCAESAAKIINTLKHLSGVSRRGADLPLKSYIDDQWKIHIEDPIPAVNLIELLVRELTHLWQLRNLPELAAEHAEGLCALVSVQYLQFIGQDVLAATRTRYYESTENLSGVGYRKLVRELLQNLQYQNNPFRYLSEISGTALWVQDRIELPADEESYLGKPYTPSAPDRATDDLRYFYYDRLPGSQQKLYSAMLKAIQAHEATVDSGGTDFQSIVKISDAIRYDHPELFWYSTLSLCGSEIQLTYGASAEESEVLQKQIDEAAQAYLKGITDEMSAYDVAIRLYGRLIAMVDYDSIALEEQRAEGGVDQHSIDYLRTICGVFLRKSAVCEGYARAIQYLLQKCGIECAEVAGHVWQDRGKAGGGGAHAWNILKIDGDYYYLDVTWDDRSNTNQTIKVKDFGFAYFCITTDELLRSREVDLCPTDLPECTATRANYYTHNGLVLDRYDPNRIKQIAIDAAANRGGSFTVKCREKAVYAQALKNLCIEGKDCFELLKAVSKKDKRIHANAYCYHKNDALRTITVTFKYESDQKNIGRV